jgi:hypothetical protein
MPRFLIAAAVCLAALGGAARGQAVGPGAAGTPWDAWRVRPGPPPAQLGAPVTTADVPPAAPPAPGSVDGAETACEMVTAGDPHVGMNLWQRTWGQAGVYGYAAGTKMAPNGIPYKPLGSLDLLFNIALNDDRSLYLFTDSQFWLQRATAGVTNPSQGQLDFSKRQFDFTGGLAWNYAGRWEARAEAYSYNNLNRGTSLAAPDGYNDGFGLENRYYLPGTNFDKGLYRFLSVGYYPTKDMIGQDGVPFKPGPFVRASVAWDVWPDRFYLYTDATFLETRSWAAKLLLADVGLAVRPFPTIPDLEFRVGLDNTEDVQARYWRGLFYVNVRIVW